MNINWGYTPVKWPVWHKWHISNWKGKSVQKFLFFHRLDYSQSLFYFIILNGDGTRLVEIGSLYTNTKRRHHYFEQKQKPSDTCFSFFRHRKETNLELNIELIKRKSVKAKVYSFFLPGTVSSYPTQISLCLVLVDLKIQIFHYPLIPVSNFHSSLLERCSSFCGPCFCQN